MGIDTTLYKVVLVAHILCAIVGFGAVTLNALYGRESQRRPGPGGAAILEANLFVSRIGEYFIYAVFLLGFALVGLSDEVWKFQQTWVWLSIALYLVGLGISHGVVFPAAKRLTALAGEAAASPPTAGPPPQAAEMERNGKILATWSPLLHLILVAILGLMVFKPGFP